MIKVPLNIKPRNILPARHKKNIIQIIKQLNGAVYHKI